EFLTGDLPSAEARLEALASRVASVVEAAAVTSARVALYTTQDRIDRALEVGLAYLRRLGVDWSTHPTDDEVRREYDAIRRRLGERSIEELVDAAPTEDPEVRATMDVLTWLEPPAVFSDENLRCLVVGRMANLS